MAPLFAYCCIIGRPAWVCMYIKMMCNSSACCWSNRLWRASPFPPSPPHVLVLCCMMHFLVIFNYSKAGGGALRACHYKAGRPSLDQRPGFGTQVTRLWSAALAGATTAGEFGYRDTGLWGTPAPCTHLLPISQTNEHHASIAFGCIPLGIIRLIINM